MMMLLLLLLLMMMMMMMMMITIILLLLSLLLHINYSVIIVVRLSSLILLISFSSFVSFLTFEPILFLSSLPPLLFIYPFPAFLQPSSFFYPLPFLLSFFLSSSILHRYSLPLLLLSMKSTRMPFMFFIPCAMLFSLFSALIFLSSLDLQKDKGIRKLRAGLSLFLLGGLLAASFSTLFLGPLYNRFPCQDILFELIAGAGFVVSIMMFYGVHSDFSALFSGNTVFKDPLDSSSLENRVRILSCNCRLTNRETEVFQLLAEGRNEPYIEEALKVSRATTKTHIKHIYQKLNVSSRQELLDRLHQGCPA